MWNVEVTSWYIKQYIMYLLLVWITDNVECAVQYTAVSTEAPAVCACHTKLIRANTNWASGGATVSGQKTKTHDGSWRAKMETAFVRTLVMCILPTCFTSQNFRKSVSFATLRLGFREIYETVLHCSTKSFEMNQGHWIREKEKVIKISAMDLTVPDTVILRKTLL